MTGPQLHRIDEKRGETNRTTTRLGELRSFAEWKTISKVERSIANLNKHHITFSKTSDKIKRLEIVIELNAPLRVLDGKEQPENESLKLHAPRTQQKRTMALTEQKLRFGGVATKRRYCHALYFLPDNAKMISSDSNKQDVQLQCLHRNDGKATALKKY